ncbi:MAG: hypothetical protein L3J05_05090, partial [Robiginitomaculum sp.]|nr:hypothetical protein [Robiginitomaculum sp.]
MRVLFPSIFLSLALVACGSPEDKVKTPVQAAAQTKPVVVPPPTRAKLSPDANGKKFYKKCVACHLANGDGIPGACPRQNSGL